MDQLSTDGSQVTLPQVNGVNYTRINNSMLITGNTEKGLCFFYIQFGDNAKIPINVASTGAFAKNIAIPEGYSGEFQLFYRNSSVYTGEVLTD